MSRKEFVVYVRDFPSSTTDADLAKFFAPLKVAIFEFDQI
jgi:hypothetical protein